MRVYEVFVKIFFKKCTRRQLLIVYIPVLSYHLLHLLDFPQLLELLRRNTLLPQSLFPQLVITQRQGCQNKRNTIPDFVICTAATADTADAVNGGLGDAGGAGDSTGSAAFVNMLLHQG